MFIKRLRAIAVTLAMVLGAATVSALAAPMLRSQAPTDVEVGPSEAVTGDASEVGEDVTATETEDATRPDGTTRGEPLDTADKDGEPKNDPAAKQRSAVGRERAEKNKAAAHGQRKGDGLPEHAQGNGNAHGKAVSSAARGETPPVGECRNHGHWVSTVAKGLASCDDNPRPPDEAD